MSDNAPMFAQLHYEVQVLEHCPIGFQAAIISARDLDLGTRGEISYVFSQAPEDICRIFRINAKSGKILLIRELDF